MNIMIFAYIVGLIGAVFLARAFLLKSVDQIALEAAGGRWVGNLHVAKSQIEQKWDGYFGFLWVVASFILQIVFTLHPVDLSLYSRLVFISSSAVIILFMLTNIFIFILCRKDGIKFVSSKLMRIDKKSTAPSSLTGAALDAYTLFGEGDIGYYQEIAALLRVKNLPKEFDNLLTTINRALSKDKRVKEKLERARGPFDWASIDYPYKKSEDDARNQLK